MLPSSSRFTCGGAIGEGAHGADEHADDYAAANGDDENDDGDDDGDGNDKS